MCSSYWIIFKFFLILKTLFLKILPYLRFLHHLYCYESILPINLKFQFVWLIILIFLTLHHLNSLLYVLHSPCTIPKPSHSPYGSLNKSLSFFIWYILPYLYYLRHVPLFIQILLFLTKVYPSSLRQANLSSSQLTKLLLPI